VIDDLHHLRMCRRRLADALAGSEQKQLLDAGFLDRLDCEREVASQIADGFALDMLDEGAVFRLVRLQLVIFDERRASASSTKLRRCQSMTEPPLKISRKRLQIVRVRSSSRLSLGG